MGYVGNSWYVGKVIAEIIAKFKFIARIYMHKVYRFRRTGYDAEQLAWDIEDRLDIKIMAYHPHDSVVGHMNTGGDEITIFIYEPIHQLQTESGVLQQGKLLTLEEENALAEVVAQHVPRPRVYRGNLAGAVTRYKDSVARIIVRDKASGDEKYASGFLYQNNRTLMTAAHVVDPDKLEILDIKFPSGSVQGRITKFESLHDLALLDLAVSVPASPFRIRHDLVVPDHLGTACVVIGYPDIPGMEPSPSFYEVSLVSLKRNYVMQQDLLELSTHLGSGCSGAPVLTLDHSLMGMIVGFPSREHIGADTQIIWPKWTPVAVTCNELGKWVKDHE